MTATDKNSTGNVLEATGISKTVSLGAESIDILRDVSMAAVAGSSVSISGASGSGKTTLLAILAGLDIPSAGNVNLLGKPLGDLDENGRAALRNGNVGFVFQSFHLLPNLTAMENVSLALEVIPGTADILARSREALETVGLGQRSGHLPSQLSGGEQQRVALARAMVARPKILFADEPTGNLDHATGVSISDMMFSLCTDSGVTLVLVTHDQELAARCNSKYHLTAGRLDS